MKKTKKNKGITLIALIVTIIVLLILAGITLVSLTGENGILNRAKIAKSMAEEAKTKEDEDLQSLEDLIAGKARDGLTEEQIRTIIREEIVGAKYQKLRSDVSIDVSTASRFVAPTDGYYIIRTSLATENQTDWHCIIWHYTSDGQAIASYNTAGGYKYQNDNGCNIYMKQGEYIDLYVGSDIQVNSSKFWYAEGCVPNQ